MAEETDEQNESDEGFDAGWRSSFACRINELRDRSPAWVHGYVLGRRAREHSSTWGGPTEGRGSPLLPGFCLLRPVPSRRLRGVVMTPSS